MTENREAIGGNLGGKYLVREREGSCDTENAEKNEENNWRRNIFGLYGEIDEIVTHVGQASLPGRHRTNKQGKIWLLILKMMKG